MKKVLCLVVVLLLIGPGYAASAAKTVKIASISSGPDHSLAVATDGTVWGWGRNDSGELGDLTLKVHASPYRVPGIKDVKNVEAGSGFSMALKKDGTVWVWGEPRIARGGKALAGPAEPFQIAKGAVQIGVGHKSFGIVLMKDGSVWGFGDPTGGHLGSEPGAGLSKIKGLPPIASISVGGRFTIALDKTGTPWGWGSNAGTPLQPGPAVIETPRRIALQNGKPLTGVKAVSAGDRYALFVLRSGEVLGCGSNEFGLMMTDSGPGAQPVQNYPKTLAIGDVKQLSAGVTHALALRSDGTLWTWGYYDDGRLSPDSYLNRDTGNVAPEPIQIRGIKGTIVHIEASRDSFRSHCLVLTSDGTVWTWGDNDYAYGVGNGELGLGLLGNEYIGKPTPIRWTA